MSRAGGLARVRLHGNPGTPEGRRLGGLHSLITHRKNKTGFLLPHKIIFPTESTLLAELLGIIAGDGHISEYQTSICTNSITDLEHAQHAKILFKRLFKIPVSLIKRSKTNACVVFISSKEVGNFLVSKGMCRGHKIRSGLCMPKWIFNNTKYHAAFIKGLFDTDGCVYVDVHTIRGKEYRNIGMAFTNRSLPLLANFKEALELLDLHPTQKTKYTVFLRREKDIQKYFRIVGSSNPKHLRKVQGYFLLKK